MATYQEAREFIEGRFYTVRARHDDQAARTITAWSCRSWPPTARSHRRTPRGCGRSWMTYRDSRRA